MYPLHASNLKLSRKFCHSTLAYYLILLDSVSTLSCQLIVIECWITETFLYFYVKLMEIEKESACTVNRQIVFIENLKIKKINKVSKWKPFFYLTVDIRANKARSFASKYLFGYLKIENFAPIKTYIYFTMSC